jgi:3-oxocholest-4-en-26-oate---CoA ligase
VAFNLADLFEVVVDAVPDRTAVVAGGTRLTYGALDERANRLANHLVAGGVGRGDHVGVCSYDRAEWLEAMFAAFKLRAVPINVNHRYVEEELAYLFDNADLVALVVEAGFRDRVDAVRPRVPALRTLVVIDDGYEEALAAAPPERPGGPRSADDRYVLYTGGTTGLPKGTIWRHEDIFFAALQGGNPGGEAVTRPEQLAAAADRPPGVYLVCPPLMHGGGQWASLIALLSGGTVVLDTNRPFDGAAAWRLVERERANAMMVVGDAMARPLTDALAAPGASYDTSSLLSIGSGGAILSPVVKEELRRLLPGVIVMDSFGASETGHNGSVLDLDGPAAGPRFKVGDTTAVLGEDGRPVTPGSGVVGRLARRGHIPLGYHKDPEKTAATFLEIDGVRWVVPGDAAMVEEDGTVHVLGRGSMCINTGGEKVYPEEVEAALKAHPDVFDALVVGIPDERFTERVAAVVRPREGRAPTLDDLAAHCRRLLAGYKVPRALVLCDELVRSPVGKPDYRWAKEVATAAAP